MASATNNRGAVATVTITRDAKKLWSCRNFFMSQPQHAGKLPLNSGDSIRVHLPPEPRPENWLCDSKFVWRVLEKDSLKIMGQMNVKVCEHQIDID